MNRALLLIFFIFVLSACSTNPKYGEKKGELRCQLYENIAKDKYADRIANIIKERLGTYYQKPDPLRPEGVKTFCSVDLTASHVERLAGKNIFMELDPQTRSALISYVGQKPNPLEALEDMLKVIGKEEPKAGRQKQKVSHNSSPAVYLTLSCTSTQSGPADRLEKVYAYFMLDKDKAVTIKKLRELKPEMETVRYGQLTTILSLGGTLGASGIPLPQVGGTGQLQFNPTYTRQLVRDVTRQMIPRTFHKIDPQTLEVVLDGEHSVPINGNTFLTIEIGVPLDYSYYVFKVEQNGNLEDYYEVSGPLLGERRVQARLFWVAEVRQVESGDSTVLEDDDSYYSVKFSGMKDIDLWEDDAVTYYLAYVKDGVQRHLRFIHPTRGFLSPQDIYFESVDDAHRFRQYLGNNVSSNVPYAFANGVEVGLSGATNLNFSNAGGGFINPGGLRIFPSH